MQLIFLAFQQYLPVVYKYNFLHFLIHSDKATYVCKGYTASRARWSNKQK